MSSSIDETGLSGSFRRVGVAATQQPAHTSNASPILRSKNVPLRNQLPAAVIESSSWSRQDGSSRSRMRRLERVAAWRLPRSKLHHFHSRPIGVVHVDTVLAIAPDFRTIKLLPTTFLHL